MKRIIIVNNNMEIGGVQKALVDLLQELKNRYAITLLLFHEAGPLMQQIPAEVHVETVSSLFRCLGMCQAQARGLLSLQRGTLAAATRLFGRGVSMKLMLLSQKKLPEHYDAAISYLHNGGMKSFYGGCNEFVLNKIDADRKIAFIHCDYQQAGSDSAYNNAIYEKFDWIAACSEGCRRAFLACVPAAEKKCCVVRNCHDFHMIRVLSEQDPVGYSGDGIHIVTVARLGHEKGIERGIRAVQYAAAQGYRLHYDVVGDGPMREQLESLIRELKLERQVTLQGATTNPYRFLKNADLMLIPSFHEAAPLVIDEAAFLGVPILSAATTSAREMIERGQLGWVCDNSQEGLNQAVESLLMHPEELKVRKKLLENLRFDNHAAVQSICRLLDEETIIRKRRA